MISMDKKYKTRDGREVRIYAVDGAEPYVVHGAIMDGRGWRAEYCWKIDGAFHTFSNGSDLIEVVPKRPRLLAWLTNMSTIKLIEDDGKDLSSTYPTWTRVPHLDEPEEK